MVKFNDEKWRSREEKKILVALDFVEEVILAHCRLKLEENQEAANR